MIPPPRRPGQPPVIDITPGASWRRAWRSALAVLVLLIVVPLVWLIGGLVLLTLVGAASIVFAAAFGRAWWKARQARADRPDIIDAP